MTSYYGGHCDLYIMVQRFCLVFLTIFNTKTYKSLKQTAGLTSCPWTTVLVIIIIFCGVRGARAGVGKLFGRGDVS